MPTGAATGRSPKRYLSSSFFIYFFVAWTFPGGAKENAIAQKSAAQRNSNRNLPLKVTLIPAAGKPTWLTFPRRRPRHVHQDEYDFEFSVSAGLRKGLRAEGRPTSREGARSSALRLQERMVSQFLGEGKERHKTKHHRFRFFVFLLFMWGTHLRAGKPPQGLFRFGT